MKKISILLVMLLPLLAAAQIKFEKGDWASVKAKAAKENKTIFIDFYTTWCGPCKVMEKNIFPLENVGTFYNANFINYKIDAEKGEGIALSQKYGVKQYPTYIIADANGDFLHQFVGSMDAEAFINKGKDALDPEKQLGKLINKDKVIAKKDIPAHLKELQQKYLPFNDEYEAYIKSLTKDELVNAETFALMKQLGGRDTNSFTYNLILKNKKAFENALGASTIEAYFYDKLLSKAYTLDNNSESHKEVLDEATALGYDFAEKIDETVILSGLLHDKKDFEGFVTAAKAYLNKYKNDKSLKYNPVFSEGSKFFLLNDELEKYIVSICDEFVAENHEQAARACGTLGGNYVRANQLEKGLAYFKKGYEIKGGAEGKNAAQYQKTFDYINGRIVTKKSGKYTINATGFEKYNGFTANLFYNSPVNIGDYDETKGVLIKEGKFTISGNVETALTGGWAIYDGDHMKAKGSIIIEPGTLPLTLKEDGSFELESNYNYYIYNGWKTHASYIKAVKDLKDFESNPDFNYKDSLTRKEFSRLMKVTNNIKNGWLEATFDNSADPIVKALAAMENLLFYDRENDNRGTKRLEILKKKIPNHYLVKTMEFFRKSEKERKKMTNSVGIGKTIKNFTAKDHQGKEFNLKDVLKKNKYVLVEFWASWCGPCRGAIPELKEAYNKYKSKGFEIVSFSIDHKKSMWDKAYKEEQIPWIDTSDLLAHKSPVAKMYGIAGVPANFLVDANGTIVALDLRGDKVEETLNKVFKK